MRAAGFSDPATNLLDALDAALPDGGTGAVSIAVVPFRPEHADVIVRACDPSWAQAIVDGSAIDALTEASAPANVLAEDGRLLVRLDDERLAALGGELETGGPDPLATRRAAPDVRWVVNLGDPNTTKALHVGHLRNLALGQSLASAAEAAGMQVLRQSRVGDFGRNMGEAMAGYLRFGGGRTPEEAGVKGDHLIGDCYVRYVRMHEDGASAARSDADDGDVVLSRELDIHDDDADGLLERWRQGDPSAVALFRDVRRWVLDGHDATFARLGIAIDRTFFESEHLDDADAFVAQALAQGVIERVASGATMYPTGEEAYPHMLISRRDGFPTQHLRYIATWDATRPQLAGTHSIAVFGTEWRSLWRYGEAMLRRLHPGADIHPSETLIHGMVIADAGVVKSSKGGALLIDTLLDAVAASALVSGLERRHRRREAEQLARVILLAFFLGQPLKQRVTITLADLLDVEKSVGCAMAQTWASAWDARYDGEPDPDPSDPDYRFLLVQSQRHRRLLVKCLETRDLQPLVRFHYHLCRWYAGARPSPRLARAMRTVLGSGLDALGLAREQSVVRA